MAYNENKDYTELPKLIDDGTTGKNNYGEWSIKSYHKLREWDLLKYIEGPTSDPPFIPALRQTVTYDGVDDSGKLSTPHVLGNAAEYQQALVDAQPWMSGNNIVLSRIVAAAPSHKLHLVKHVKYAKEAWESLRSVYQPRNSQHAATIKVQIMTYRCAPDMNVAKWLNDMQCLYSSLSNLDIECMSDRDFALAILDLMPQDDSWRGFVSGLRADVCVSDAQAPPIDLVTLITIIREEYWYRHKDDDETTSHIFSAHFEAQKRSATKRRKKRSRRADLVATRNKHARGPNPERANLRCTNPHCETKSGHDTTECFGYKGAKEGQYGGWWRGPWNIHLPESQRSKDNNRPPRSHPVYRYWKKKVKPQSMTSQQ